MMRFALSGLAALVGLCPLALAPLAAQEAGAPIARGIDPAKEKTGSAAGEDLMLSWQSGAIACDSGEVTASAWVAPHNQYPARKLLQFPVTMGFAIDATGRAVDIRVIEGGYVEGGLKASFDAEENVMRFDPRGLLRSVALRDLMPSLRASRFAPGAPHTGCRVVYSPRYSDAADAAPATLAATGAVPGTRLSAAVRDRLGGGDCNSVGWPSSLLQAYPDWRRIAARPGARKWSWVRFDIDERGVPANVAIIASSGDADLDAESLRAFRDSRFAEGPRTGCASAWWRDPGTIPAPPPPDRADFAGYRACEAERGWAKEPRLTFPQGYDQRAIEGWAVLGFDIAADGKVENVTVLAAQPSEEFGTAGRTVLLSGLLEPGAGALTGCIARVTFVKDRAQAERAVN